LYNTEPSRQSKSSSNDPSLEPSSEPGTLHGGRAFRKELYYKKIKNFIK